MINISIDTLKGVGEKRKIFLNNLGIYQVSDLLYYLPYKYLDISKKELFSNKHNGEQIVAEVTVISKPFYKKLRTNLNMTIFYVSDGHTKVKCTFFNQPHIVKQINKDDVIIVSGVVSIDGSLFTLTNPKIFYKDKIKNDIITYYKLPKGLQNRTFEKLVSKVIDLYINQIIEHYPDDFRQKYSLCNITYALQNIHRPADINALDIARSRLSFDEMVMFSLVLKNNKLLQENQQGIPININTDEIKIILSILPYSLTNAQNRVLNEIIEDISCGKNDTPMNRLIQGDVGCGKTIIAILSAYLISKSGYQSIIMAPTEILANQHYEEFSSVLEQFNINTALLTSSTSPSEKEAICNDLVSNKIHVLVGTHAVLEENVKFHNLGLTVTDEQHRFGVRQRSLVNKGRFPHKIIMSATPVPRTLALFLYGDLDISSIDEMPPGRKIVKTRIINSHKRNDMYQYIAEQIKNSQQAYIVCPLISDSEKIDAVSADSLYSELNKSYFTDIDIGLLHGKLKSNEKQKLLEDFKMGKLRALVSTTVIEVGINVPSATLMVVENPERFGLAQLHQLRGRVGRGSKQSWCFLSSDTDNPTSLERLRALVEMNDGFELSQKDLELRGPGEFFGHRQSGVIDYKIMSLMTDTNMMEIVSDAIDYLKSNDREAFDKLKEISIAKYNNRLKDTILN